MRHAWWIFLAVALTGVGAQVLLPLGAGRDVAHATIAALAVAAVLSGIRMHRPVRLGAWVLLTLGAVAWLLGSVLRTAPDGLPFAQPALAEALHLISYPLLAGALYRFARSGDVGEDRWFLLDTVIAGLGVGLVTWTLVVGAEWHAAAPDLLAQLRTIARPAGDVLLVVLLLQLLGDGPRRSIPLALLVGGTGALIAGDAMAEAGQPAGPDAALLDAALLDAAWLAMFALLGAAALHPAMRTLGEVRQRERRGLSLGRVVVVGMSLLLLPGIALLTHLLGIDQPPLLVAVVSMVVVPLVAVRIGGLVHRMRAQADLLEGLASQDDLTGLGNRRSLLAALERACTGSRRTGERWAVLVIGLEHYRDIDDTLGPRTAEGLLRAVGDRLRSSMTAVEPARLGGDQFAVLVRLREDDDVVAAVDRAEYVRAAVAAPVEHEGMTINLGAAIGVALLPEDGREPDTLLQRAEVALAAARSVPRRLARYEVAHERGGALAPQLMAELEAAIAGGQIVVHYQPQVDVVTGRVHGLEALARWDHPVHGLLSPGQFVPAAERTGLVRPLTRCVLDQALADLATWRVRHGQLTVAVNLSVRDLLDPSLVETVANALHRHGVVASALELEVTETMAMVDPVRATEALTALDVLGVLLSVDDYGAGYGSLAYLQKLPVRRVKIDRSFVADITADEASAAIVRSTIDLAAQLGLTVVAEGIEDDDTLLLLQEMGCWTAQGYGLSRPVPAAEVEAVIAEVEARAGAVLGAGRIPAQRQMVNALD